MTDADGSISEIALPDSRVRLHWRSVRPVSTATCRLLILHGYGEHSGRYAEFMKWMAERGVACEAIDFRGHGRSTGWRGYIRRWDDYIDDLEAFIEAHQQRAGPDAPPIFVLGHSHGGLITAAAAERGILSRAGVIGCILSSPYLRTKMPIPAIKKVLAAIANYAAPWLQVPTGMKGEWLTSDPEMADEDRADNLNFRVATPRWFVTMRAAQQRAMADAAQFKLPVLCLAGDADIVSDPAATVGFFRAAGSSDKSLYRYPRRVHELLREVGRQQIFADIIGWIRARVIAK